MKLTYLGQSSFLLESSKATILFDPMIKVNPLAKKVDVDNLVCDVVMLSHAHFDHTADAFEICLRNDALLISNWEITEYYKNKGIQKVHPMNIGGAWNFDFGKVKMVYAMHSSSFPDGSYGGNACGYILELDGKRIYFAGDTGLTQEMKLIGEFQKPNLAILPIGDNFTMGLEDAVHASDFIQCNNIIGMHFDTVDYIKIDHKHSVDYFNKFNKQLTLIKVGNSIEI